MQISQHYRIELVLALLGVTVAGGLVGCADTGANLPSSFGGAPASGGQTATGQGGTQQATGSGGANNATGGANNATGGANNATGGANNATGGANNATGGANNATGGANNATGGANTATGGANNATGGADSATGGASAAGGTSSTGGASTSSSGAASFSPLCGANSAGTAIAKGIACTAADPQLCYKTCGPENKGFKSETCTASAYVEQSGCSFPTGDYACYKIPTAMSSTCPATAPQHNTACTVAVCTPCNLGGTATGTYLDGSAASKVGWCVCSSAGKWSCASTTAWPCPGNTGC